MKKILKSPNNLVRRVLSKTSPNISEQSIFHDSRGKKQVLMSEDQQLAAEIKSLKVQIENLKAAISVLQNDTEKKEVAIANIAREKEKITMDLLKQKRSNGNLLKQLEDERKYYYQEKEQYCHEINEFKKLRQSLSTTSTANPQRDEISKQQYKKEISKIKETLNQTLEANYNLSIKFLRMKNTKTCLKTELKTLKLEHEKLTKDYKAKIESLSEELDNIIQERLNAPISCSSKKYLHLVKQNSCLVYENLCLQLEVDNLHLKLEKSKLDKTKSETNSRLKYVKHEASKSSNLKNPIKRVRIKEERPEKLEREVFSLPSTSQGTNEEILKIYERHQLPGVPDIKVLGDFEPSGSQSNKISPQTPHHIENKFRTNLRKISQKPSSKLDLFQVSRTSNTASRSLMRVHSSPDLTLNSRIH